MKTLDKQEINGYTYTKIEHDVNRNPRWVVHHIALLTDAEKQDQPTRYQAALNRARKIGGRKYHNKSYGGGIVFQTYNVHDLASQIEELKAAAEQK